MSQLFNLFSSTTVSTPPFLSFIICHFKKESMLVALQNIPYPWTCFHMIRFRWRYFWKTALQMMLYTYPLHSESCSISRLIIGETKSVHFSPLSSISNLQGCFKSLWLFDSLTNYSSNCFNQLFTNDSCLNKRLHWWLQK